MKTKARAVPIEEREMRVWLRRGIWLVLGTMLYNMAEAVVAIWSGIVAGSIALVGFGLDSVIELCAAGLLLWRLRVEARGAARETVQRTERIVRRFVGMTFLALSLYVVTQSTWTLWQKDAPEESIVGIVLAALSLAVMPLVSLGKLKAARIIGSEALRSEAKETLACSCLSLTLLIGLVANAAIGWWWADPVAALLMVPWLIKEGVEGVQAKECC
jgi:divalent metal cation (Fe/Co/Zn/Cd) transporter